MLALREVIQPYHHRVMHLPCLCRRDVTCTNVVLMYVVTGALETLFGQAQPGMRDNMIGPDYAQLCQPRYASVSIQMDHFEGQEVVHAANQV